MYTLSSHLLSLLPPSEHFFQLRGALFESGCTLLQAISFGAQLCDHLKDFLVRGLRHGPLRIMRMIRRPWPASMGSTGNAGGPRRPSRRRFQALRGGESVRKIPHFGATLWF